MTKKIDEAARVMDQDQDIAKTVDDAAIYAAFYKKLRSEHLSEDHCLELTREYMQGLLGTFRSDIHLSDG